MFKHKPKHKTKQRQVIFKLFCECEMKEITDVEKFHCLLIILHYSKRPKRSNGQWGKCLHILAKKKILFVCKLCYEKSLRSVKATT